MSDEEKKAIELLKKLQKKTPYIIWGDGIPYNKSNQIQTILNVIEKQQKEIEDLKETNNDNAEKSLLNDIFIKKNYISKDKIRERIKHNEKQKNIVESVAKFEKNNNGITAEGIEGLNDLMVYRIYEAVINELNYLLKGN